MEFSKILKKYEKGIKNKKINPALKDEVSLNLMNVCRLSGGEYFRHGGKIRIPLSALIETDAANRHIDRFSSNRIERFCALNFRPAIKGY
ncbi:MAG: hypothetical protein HQK54_12610 [Oligoflexales bacterium]|nr:hypothetical protein [Oligoflexales bacterium]